MKIDRYALQLTLVFTVIILISSIYDLYVCFADDYPMDLMWFLYAKPAILIIAALAVILDRKRSLPRAAGIYAVAVGINYILEGYVDTDIFVDTVLFYVGLVMLILGIALFINGIIYLRGASTSNTAMLYVTAILVASDVFSLLLMIRMGTDIMTIIETYMSVMSRIFTNIIFILLLMTEGVRKNTFDWKVSNSIFNAKTALYTDRTAFIERDDLIRINDWIEGRVFDSTYGDDIVESEISIDIHYPRNKVRRMLVQRWRDDGTMHATVLNDGAGSYMQGFNFDIRSAIPDNDDLSTCNSVRFYGDRGMFIILKVGSVKSAMGTAF